MSQFKVTQAPRLIPLILLILLGLIWGSGYVINKFATQSGVPFLGYSFWQSAGPAILLLLCAQFTSHPTRWDFASLRFYTICGLFGLAIPNSIMYFAAPHLPSGILAVIVNTVPLMAYPLALIAQQEQFHPTRILGIAIGLAGTLILIIPSNLSHLPSWAGITLITPLCFAATAIYINHRPPENANILSLSGGMLMASSILLLPIVLYRGDFYPLATPFAMRDYAVLFEILLSSLGYVTFFLLLKYAGPVYYSLVGGMVSLTGLFWGYMLYDEILSANHTLAIITILTGITLVTSQQKKWQKDVAMA